MKLKDKKFEDCTQEEQKWAEKLGPKSLEKYLDLEDDPRERANVWLSSNFEKYSAYRIIDAFGWFQLGALDFIEVKSFAVTPFKQMKWISSHAHVPGKCVYWKHRSKGGTGYKV